MTRHIGKSRAGWNREDHGDNASVRGTKRIQREIRYEYYLIEVDITP